jgi:hypothetical protein
MARRTTSLALVAALSACMTPEQELITCDDIGGAASFDAIAELMVEPGAKSCAACHNTKTPVLGVNLETRALAYDALTTRFATIYLQIASGEMPEDGEPWSDEELRALRTWYCRGGFHDP